MKIAIATTLVAFCILRKLLTTGALQTVVVGFDGSSRAIPYGFGL